VVTGALVVALCVLHVVWFQRFRSGYITDVDEAGYLALGMRESHDLGVGPHAFLQSVMHTGVAGPVVPVSTVPFYVVFGNGIGTGWAVMVPYFALLLGASAALARRLMPAWWAALAVLVIGTAPGVTDFTRIYHFAVPAAALLTTGLWFLTKSDGLLLRRWALAAGAMLGLMVLARIMTVAYLPGVAIALAIQVAAAPEGRRRRLENLVLLAVLGAALAAPWYVLNFDLVRDYLTGGGYGPEAGRYGTEYSILTFDYWVKELKVIGDYLFAPLLLVLTACFAAAAAAALAASRASWRIDIRRAISRDAFLLTVVVVEGYLVLSSSANVGTGFPLPWLPALMILALAAAARISAPPARLALVLALIGVSAFNLAVKNGVSVSLSRPATMRLPVLGPVVEKDGRDRVYQALQGVGYAIEPPPRHLPELDRRWLGFDAALVAWMNRRAHAYGQQPSTLVATGDWVLDDNRLSLASELTTGQAFPVGKVDGPDTVESYRLQFERSGNTFVMTSDPPPRQVQSVTPLAVAKAAIDCGFREVKSSAAPDGRRVLLWWRSSRP
jgi:hypothetical protein